MRLVLGVVIAGLVSGACASGGSPGAASSGTAAAPAGQRGNANLITQSEIAAANLETIYEVIERLRPNMLRTRGQMGRISGATATESGASSSSIKVYHNGTNIGDLSMLRTIQASSVRQVQFLSSSDATTRFGTGHDAGAILVTSK
jgi:hypothetical protein